MYPVSLIVAVISSLLTVVLLLLTVARSRRQAQIAEAARTSTERELSARKAELSAQAQLEVEQLRRDLTASFAKHSAAAQEGERVARDALAAEELRLTRLRASTQDEIRHTQEDAVRAERREAKLLEREQALDGKLEASERRDARLRERDEAFTTREQDLATRQAQLVVQEQEIDKRLSLVAGMTPEQARAELLSQLEQSLAAEHSLRIARHEKDLQTRTKELSVEILSRAIQRYAAEHTAETTITRVHLADDDMKGRIIGKEGRNIKSFEQATGVDLLIDDAPGTITISCFSGLRREMARRTLEILLEDGRIHPGRIEEAMTKVQQDIDREVIKLGEDAAFTCEVSGLHPHLIKLLGKLHWRTSYGQNVLKHTQEVAFLCGHMAGDLGLDPKLGRRCGLMHDIGKAIDHEQEGSHPELGYQALKRYGESEIVANAALAHHEGHQVLSAYTILAAAADAISAARPGARSKNVEGYIKRLEQIEEIACSYTGVQKAYAIQAGRELRVIVSGKDVADAELPKLARDIARRIEDEVAYPGEVKVTLIREMRHFAVAR